MSDSPRSLRTVMLLMAFACGASVANLYYAQPLLELIAHTFHIGQGAAAIVVTATQIGYACGLAFVLPLGDLVENRALTSRTLLLTAVALLAAAISPDFGLFLAVSVVIGVTSVVAQILVPLAAHLAPPEARGRFVGQVMSGLLLGILLARSVASLAAAAWGWRSIYLVSAGLMVLTSAALLRMLPRRAPEHVASYPQLLGSVVRLARSEPVLRQRALSQACMFAAFTAYWTAITYELISAHHLSQTGVAIFALVGAAGAGCAPIAGRLGDRGFGAAGRIAAIGLGLTGLLLAGFGAGNLILLGAGGVLLDVAVQGHQVLGQRDIYQLHEGARARVNTVYMGTTFLGGALSSAITGVIHDAAGWAAVCLFGAAFPLIAAGIWAWARYHPARPAPAAPEMAIVALPSGPSGRTLPSSPDGGAGAPPSGARGELERG